MTNWKWYWKVCVFGVAFLVALVGVMISAAGINNHDLAQIVRIAGGLIVGVPLGMFGYYLFG